MIPFRSCAIAMYVALLVATTYVVVYSLIISTWSWAILTWPLWAYSLAYWWRKR